ncbi:MAG: hypothetical protein JKY45_03215 [Emcibacter sp.]|nr:hypothetical protein [Emcibacter sp.]
MTREFCDACGAEEKCECCHHCTSCEQEGYDVQNDTTRWFQSDVRVWTEKCFGSEVSSDTVERNHRFLEEALELVQACGCSAAEARQLVEYVFLRPVGEKRQEVGGVMVTLAALCNAQDIDLDRSARAELSRINDNSTIEKIRFKQANKPKHGPLPSHQEMATIDFGCIELTGRVVDSFAWKWIERLIWDDDITQAECISVLKHAPAAPWNDAEIKWDTSHLRYHADVKAMGEEKK